MEEKKFSSILPAVRLIHLSYRLVGMCPYKVPQDITSDHLPFSFLGMLNTIFFVAVSCTALYFNYLVDVYENLTSSAILNYISRLILMGGLLFTMLFTIANTIVKKTTWDMVMLLHQIDTRLSTIGIHFNYKRQFYMVAGFTILWISFVCLLIGFHCIYNYLGKMNYIKMIIHTTSHYVAVGAYAVFMSNFFYMLAAIYSRFAAININFSRHFLVKSSKNVTPRLDKDREIKELRIAHDELNDLLDKVNSFLSIVAMAGITLSIFLWVLACSSMYKRNIDKEDHILLSPMGYVVWSSYFAFFVVTVIVMASWVTNEGRRTAVLIHKGMNLHPYHPDMKELQCRHPIASCGLFAYDYTLLYSVLGSISIYTTIFIQFDSFTKVPNNGP